MRCWTRRLLLLWTRSYRIPSSRRRSVSRNRKLRKRTVSFEEDRSPSWSTTTFEWLALMTQYSMMLIYSLLLFMMTIFRNSIQDGMKFCCLCQRFHPMISCKVCTNWGHVSPRNSKLYGNCTTWRFIRSYRFPTIKSWKQWWKGDKIRNFDYETFTSVMGELKQEHWSRIERDWVALKEEKVSVSSGKNNASVRKETDAVSVTKRNPRSCKKTRTHRPPHLLSHPYHQVEVCRGREVSEARVTMGRFFGNHADIIWEVPARANALWILAFARVPIL